MLSPTALPSWGNLLGPKISRATAKIIISSVPPGIILSPFLDNKFLLLCTYVLVSIMGIVSFVNIISSIQNNCFSIESAAQATGK